MVVARSPVRVVSEEGIGRPERIHGIEVAALLVLSPDGFLCIAGIDLVAGPAVRHLLHIPFHAVVHLPVAEPVGEDDAPAAFQLRKFQPVGRRLRVKEVGVGIDSHSLFPPCAGRTVILLAA